MNGFHSISASCQPLIALFSLLQWYELGEISQAKAAEIAGLSRAEFINALSRYQVDFMQYTAQELAEELGNVD